MNTQKGQLMYSLMLAMMLLSFPLMSQHVFIVAITDLNNTPVTDASLSVQYDSITSAKPELSFKISPRYNDTPNRYKIEVTTNNIENCLLIIKHPSYETSQGRISELILRPDIKVAPPGTPILMQGSWTLPYCSNPRQLVIYPSKHGQKNLAKLDEVISAMGMEFLQSVSSINDQGVTGILIQKKNKEPFLDKECLELALLRQKKRWIKSAGPAISCSGSKYLVALSNKINIVVNCSEQEARVIAEKKKCTVLKVNGGKKTRQIQLLLKVPDGSGLETENIAQDFRKTPGVISSEVILFQVTGKSYDIPSVY